MESSEAGRGGNLVKWRLWSYLIGRALSSIVRSGYRGTIYSVVRPKLFRINGVGYGYVSAIVRQWVWKKRHRQGGFER